ncbi:MAG: hypothetical protein JST58_19535 [Bacteroidetes bacterium]|nr:hypothetical protein [Bacteroidota bacterium]
MKRKLLTFWVLLLGIMMVANAQQKQLWQIGSPDKKFAEFSLAPGDWSHYTNDGLFVVGRSDAAKDWPYVHPAPADSWAGTRPHHFSIFFGIKKLPTLNNKKTIDSATLKINFADIQSKRAVINVSINGHVFVRDLPSGKRPWMDGDWESVRPTSLDIRFPISFLKKGDNTISITNEGDAWFYYDWLGLDVPNAIRSQPSSATIMLTRVKALPFISLYEGKEFQAAGLSLINTGDSTNLTAFVDGLAPQQIGLPYGSTNTDIRIPEVATDSTVTIILKKGKEIVSKKELQVYPVRKLTTYILPHSHNDLGYTEIQTKVEEKQINNLLTGMKYAQLTKDYPEGAKFVWNLEGFYAADLFLQRMSKEQQNEFYKAVEDGHLAMNGMYFNTLTGLCRPEELLKLFSFTTETAKRCHVKVDAAMISDVPGYTWGTVAAMAQAGIKYFSAAPNNFDRIGDILQKWEDRPFYWMSQSGKQKVLVWIPYQGYALSHGLANGPSPDFVASYVEHLKNIDYPYNISYIRWSGHGDNAVPDLQISDFVKNWSSKFIWPKFIISSTSTAFHAFEEKYGTYLPVEKGDWTGYWEDGAGSSALETAENRATSDRLSQAQSLWSMLKPDQFPIDKFDRAWKQVLLYDEHTWGADCSVTDPLSQKTKEQWDIKKSYVTHASEISKELMASALSGFEKGESNNVNLVDTIDVFNTSSWERTNLVKLPASLSAKGDLVKDENGQVIPSQRLSTGELAFIAQDVPPYAAKRYTIYKGKMKDGVNVQVSGNSLDNGIIRVTLDELSGGISSIRKIGLNNEFADTAGGYFLNDYLYLEGKDLSQLKRNGPVKISVKEQGTVLAILLVESDAPGCNKLTREIQLVKGMDYVELTDILDKRPAVLNPHPGDYAWANTEGKESLNIGFPFQVPDGMVRLDLPLAIMQPVRDQIPSACKNWLEVGRWADVSNKDFGITLATLDAPLIQVGGITANLLGGQSNPAVWRKSIEPTQKLYSWALNNHWETNYRATQEGIISLRYALQPHVFFNSLQATRFSTELSQPLVVCRALNKRYKTPKFSISSDELMVLAFKPSEDGKAWILTLYNPTMMSQSGSLKWNSPIGKTFYSNIQEDSLQELDGQITLEAYDVVTLRVEKF